jgi:predicted ribosome-associated RNA-binding protein Tma20
MDKMQVSLKDLVKNFSGYSYHMKKNIEIVNSGIDHWSLNFCFTEKEISKEEAYFIKDKLNKRGLIISKELMNKELMETEGFKYVGKFPYMKREESKEFYKAPIYDDIEILSVTEHPMVFKDFLKVFSNVRSLDPYQVESLFKTENLSVDNHFFVAYASDTPVGILYAISYGNDAFIVEVSVKESHRDSGILNAMAKYAKEYAIGKGIFNFHSVPTSEFSTKVMYEHGYKTIGSYHFWQNSE